MQDNPRRGILLMIATTIIFAAQDGISRYLAGSYDIITIVAIRYWFFALFVCAFSARKSGEFKRAATTSQPWLQVGCGFVGVLLILQPGSAAFGINAIIPLCAAVLMATYGVSTRFAARRDNTLTSFFWTGVAGAVAITCVAPLFWHPPQGADWWWMVLLCITGASGHYCLISALDATHASTIQPFAYLQLVFASAIGIVIFSDQLDRALVIGSVMIVGSGLFALSRERLAHLSSPANR